MNRRVDMRTVLKFVKLICLPTCTWPLSLNSGPSVIFLRDVVRWSNFIHLTIAETGLLYAILQQSNDVDRIILIVTELAACLLIHGLIVLCGRMSDDLQVLFHRIDEFVKNGNAEEVEVVQKIVDRCSSAYSIPPFLALIGSSMYIVAPAFNSQILPLAAQYPFSVTTTWIRWPLYFSQVWTVVVVSCTGNVDIMCAILLWFVVARFRILSAKIRKSREAEDIRNNIATHIELLEYVDLMKPVVQGLTVVTAYMTIFCLIGAGYMLLRRPSLYEMVRFGCFELITLSELLIFCWPADNLIEASEDVGEAAATCEWIGKSSEMRKDLVLMIQRSRMPVIIHEAGILPPLSLQLWASTLSSNFGYLTALRSVMDATE